MRPVSPGERPLLSVMEPKPPVLPFNLFHPLPIPWETETKFPLLSLPHLSDNLPVREVMNMAVSAASTVWMHIRTAGLKSVMGA
jgi:hypothetical protein